MKRAVSSKCCPVLLRLFCLMLVFAACISFSALRVLAEDVSLTLSVQKDGYNVSNLKMRIGEYETLVANINTDASVTWFSSNSSVASVTDTGKITAHTKGFTTITVTATNEQSSKMYDVYIEVVPIYVEKIELSDADKQIKLLPGESRSISATIVPDNATEKGLIWASDNPNVASVDENGKITGISNGSTNVKVSSSDGKAENRVGVTVENILVNSISSSYSEIQLKSRGESKVVDISMSPSNPTNSNWDFSINAGSENISASKQGQNSLKIEAVKAGTAEITLRSSDGHASGTIKVTVTIEASLPNSISILGEKNIVLKIGDTHTFATKLSYADENNKKPVEIKWSVDKDTVASIDALGVLTAKSRGTTQVTVSFDDSSIKDTATVTVEAGGEAPTPLPSSPFSDVQNSAFWAYESILRCYERGMISGYPDGTFRPQKQITRVEAAMLIAKAFDIRVEESRRSSFSDIPDDMWCISVVEATKDYIPFYTVNGNRYFRPNAAATREDIISAIVKAKGGDINANDSGILQTNFKDYESISSNLRKYIEAAVAANLAKGYEDGTFRAQRLLTRAEVAQLFYQASKIGYFNKDLR